MRGWCQHWSKIQPLHLCEPAKLKQVLYGCRHTEQLLNCISVCSQIHWALVFLATPSFQNLAAAGSRSHDWINWWMVTYQVSVRLVQPGLFTQKIHSKGEIHEKGRKLSKNKQIQKKSKYVRLTERMVRKTAGKILFYLDIIFRQKFELIAEKSVHACQQNSAYRGRSMSNGSVCTSHYRYVLLWDIQTRKW